MKRINGNDFKFWISSIWIRCKTPKTRWFNALARVPVAGNWVREINAKKRQVFYCSCLSLGAQEDHMKSDKDQISWSDIWSRSFHPKDQDLDQYHFVAPMIQTYTVIDSWWGFWDGYLDMKKGCKHFSRFFSESSDRKGNSVCPLVC